MSQLEELLTNFIKDSRVSQIDSANRSINGRVFIFRPSLTAGLNRSRIECGIIIGGHPARIVNRLPAPSAATMLPSTNGRISNDLSTAIADCSSALSSLNESASVHWQNAPTLASADLLNPLPESVSASSPEEAWSREGS